LVVDREFARQLSDAERNNADPVIAARLVAVGG
jgi:hypothetical protein